MKNKKARIGILSTLGILGTSLVPFASGTQAEAVGTALGTVASDILAVITSVAPVALSVAGAFLVWRYGMKFFKSISK